MSFSNPKPKQRQRFLFVVDRSWDGTVPLSHRLFYRILSFLPIHRTLLIATIVIVFCASAVGQTPIPQQQTTPNDNQTQPLDKAPIPAEHRALKPPELYLREFKPIPTLKLPRTEISKASFAVVDAHSHFQIRMRHDPEALRGFVQMMDRNNIAVCVSLDATLGHAMEEHMSYLWTDYRDRFVLFTNINFRGEGAVERPQTWACNQPDFVRRIVEQLEFAASRGISGLKIFKSFGLTDRNADGSLIAIDDPKWNPIWESCGRLGLPVIMHTADPSAFFMPINVNNERYEELERHPEWAFPADRFPTRASLHAARNRVIERNAKTIFIAAHLGNDGEDLQETAQLIDKHPNLYLEIASRISELGRQPYSAKRFLEKYSDRILFGTDGPWPEARLHAYWRFLETDDENFAYSEKDPPPQGMWSIFGVRLSETALKKIYHENAAKIIPGVSERLSRWNR